ncbi:hypothetical protein CYY_004100 [Polysphondylium violaceum]|uniref:DUF218 domain-containing protein n=1 Tax=Polysphondylium violaceum TaxID=133409 RepID=A0A8J4V0N2_9MYCE|nr:hypothetical protein CYY_004100 [Polysphondylium violaceum]
MHNFTNNHNNSNSLIQLVYKYKVRVLVLVVLSIYLLSLLSFKSNETVVVNKPTTTGGQGTKKSVSFQTTTSKTVANDVPLESHNVAITVLGFTLHSDGMPTKILNDRVLLAATHYRELKAGGANPLIFLAGKGKGSDSENVESEYKSEADAMKSIAKNNGIEDKDIIIDQTSTNTAENALNTLKYLESKKIDKLIIATSDFHVLRAQYIFQTIFPSYFELEFIQSTTPPTSLKSLSNKEKALWESSQKDLEKLDLLKIPGEKAFGYHPFRNVPRWKMIEREIENDINRNFRTIPAGATMVDYGSNQGYFSVHLAKKVPQALMVSLEGEAMKEYDDAAVEHEKKMVEFNVTNNFLCRTHVKTPMFTQLAKLKHVYEYQLCLSVFHWFGMKTKEHFEEVLFQHLVNARTTFIELPEAKKYLGNEGQHAWRESNIWFDGRTEVEVLADIKAKYNMKMSWKILGALKHDNKTIRKVIRVDVRSDFDSEDQSDHRRTLNLETLKSTYECGKLMYGKKIKNQEH